MPCSHVQCCWLVASSCGHMSVCRRVTVTTRGKLPAVAQPGAIGLHSTFRSAYAGERMNGLKLLSELVARCCHAFDRTGDSAVYMSAPR
jgi:hypothetical protein